MGLTRAISWSQARRILCVRLDTLGDVLMTSPALRALKESDPDRRLTLLTSSAGAEISSLIPEIDGVITYGAPWMKSTTSRTTTRPETQMIERLHLANFDAAVIFTVYTQSPLPAAFLCYLAEIPLRLAHSRENPYQLLTDWVPETEPHQQVRHEVQRQLDLVASVGARTTCSTLSLRVPQQAREAAQHMLVQSLGLTRPWIVVHPGATAASRRYPPESFARAADLLVGEMGCQIVFTGDQGEQDLVEGIRGTMRFPSVSLAGRLSLGELAAVIESAAVLITNNTGPVHMAAAVGSPVVDLYALTNPQHTPWGVPHRVLFHDVPCKYCYKSVCPEGHHDCLRLVAPQAVVDAVRKLLEEKMAISLAG